MLKATVLLALIASTNACCGLAFTSCCQSYAYAPPRIIGYERIPLYAKVPVQQAPPPPAYPVAPAPVNQEPVPSYPQPVVQQPVMMPQPTYYQQPQTVVVQEPRPVMQPVVVQETPAYVPQTPTVVVQDYSAPRIPMAPVAAVALAQPGYAQPGLAVAQPVGVAQPASSLPTVIETNGVDFNGGGAPLQVPTAKALKLRRSYLKQVKAL